MGLRTSVRSWSERTRPRPVVLSSPYPVEECLRRLGQVTTTRTSESWYLDARTAVLPDPRFRGDVGPASISIVRFDGVHGRGGVSFSPRLDVRPEPAAGGGTTLTGTIGVDPYTKDFIRATTVGAGLLSLALIAAGTANLVGGHIIGLLFVLAPLFLAGRFGSVSVLGLPFLEEHIAKLIEDANKTLGSTATFPGQVDDGSGAWLQE
jgi:hypothetical protein